MNLKSFLLQDGLLSQGNHDLIMRVYNKIPKFSSDGKRLQVTVYMLNFDVSKHAGVRYSVGYEGERGAGKIQQGQLCSRGIGS